MAQSVSARLKAAFSNPAWVCFVWFGMTAGVSLLATPIKFTAPTLSRAAALDVGRVTFTALNKAELMALVLLLIVVRVSGLARRYWAAAGVLALIVLAQSIWLLPELSERTQIVVNGGELPPAPFHAIYSTLELTKLAILFVTGVLALGDRRGSDLSA